MELASRGESLLPEHSAQQETLRLHRNTTLLATIFFKYKLCCLVFLISPSDYLDFNSFRLLKKIKLHSKSLKSKPESCFTCVQFLFFRPLGQISEGKKWQVCETRGSFPRKKSFGNRYKGVHSPRKPTAVPGVWFLMTQTWSSRTHPQQHIIIIIHSDKFTQDFALSYEKSNFSFNILSEK